MWWNIHGAGPSLKTLNTVVGMFAAPSRAFAAIRAQKPVYLPFMLLLAGGAVVGFAAAVTPLDPQTMSDAAAKAIENLPPEQRARVTPETVQSGGYAFLALAPVFSAIGEIAFLLIFGLVLWVAANVARERSSFRASLSLAAWASLPVLITDIAAVADVVVGHGQWSDNVALNVILFGLEPQHTRGLPVPPLIELWVAALVAVGFRQWYAASAPKAAGMGVLALGVHIAAWGLLWWPSS